MTLKKSAAATKEKQWSVSAKHFVWRMHWTNRTKMSHICSAKSTTAPTGSRAKSQSFKSLQHNLVSLTSQVFDSRRIALQPKPATSTDSMPLKLRSWWRYLAVMMNRRMISARPSIVGSWSTDTATKLAIWKAKIVALCKLAFQQTIKFDSMTMRSQNPIKTRQEKASLLIKVCCTRAQSLPDCVQNSLVSCTIPVPTLLLESLNLWQRKALS